VGFCRIAARRFHGFAALAWISTEPIRLTLVRGDGLATREILRERLIRALLGAAGHRDVRVLVLRSAPSTNVTWAIEWNEESAAPFTRRLQKYDREPNTCCVQLSSLALLGLTESVLWTKNHSHNHAIRTPFSITAAVPCGAGSAGFWGAHRGAAVSSIPRRGNPG
jgi:hypothetical protein